MAMPGGVVRKWQRCVDIDLLLPQLSSELRKVGELYFFEDLTCADVATRLGYPVWKARKLLSEMLRALRELFGVRVFEIARGHEVRYLPQFLPAPEADLWLSRLLSEVPFQPETITMYGKQFVLERQTALYGANYDYNPTAQPARAWSPLMTELKVLVEQAVGLRFHSALCKLYPDGEAYIGWHHDAGNPRVIASVSLGAAREIRFAEAGSRDTPCPIELGHGSLLLIPESVNEHFKHMVPKSKHVTRPRINVTFQKFQRGLAETRPGIRFERPRRRLR